jgi:hypothetical protein
MIPVTTMGALSRGRKVLGHLATDRGLLISALCLVSAIRLGLLVFRVRMVGRVLAWLIPRKPEVTRDPSIADRVTRVVLLASRVVPGATCLTQALAAHVLLERHGFPTRLHIGVVREGAQTTRGHAWVESQGMIVIGGAMSGGWSPLFTVEGARRWSPRPGWPS